MITMVAIDIVSKERYNCSNISENTNDFPKGIFLKPIYKKDLVKGSTALKDGTIFCKVGKVPSNLLNKQVEGNLVIVRGNYICYYTNFVNIDRNILALLPMGLFTDSLLKYEIPVADTIMTDVFTYTKQIQFEIPFQKGSASFTSAYLSKFYDSIGLDKYKIKKIELRAYSSVEGSEAINKSLMKQRANAIIQEIKKYEPSLSRIKIIAAENWLDFFRDIANTKFSELNELSKFEIKQSLTDKAVLNEIEPILSKERKVVLTFFLEEKSFATNVSQSSILAAFNKAVNARNINAARAIQKEIVERIMDNRLPADYINKLEVPKAKECSMLINDNETYKYLLKITSEYEALENFLELRKLDSLNDKVNYNICALKFFIWSNGGDSSDYKNLLNEINSLEKQGINRSLVKRMLINYHILKSEYYMLKYNYSAKDSSVVFIRSIYKQIDLTDNEIYLLAKYYTYYSHNDWAIEMIEPRIDKINANEDLVFYYINLMFFNTSNFDSDKFKNAVLNSINLNRKRYCNFFLPNDKGGSSMQLLEYEALKRIYCESCKQADDIK